MHKPDRHSDTIDRFTMDRAVREGKPVYGIELGPFGTFTLRTVHPWRVGGKLVGYLELGGEIEHITAELSEILNAEVVMTIDKKYLNRTGWEEGLKFLKKTGNWEQFEKSVVTEQTMESLPSELGKIMSRTHEKHAGTVLYLEAGDRKYYGGIIPVFDAGKQLVGDFFIVTDLTAPVASLNKRIALFLAGGIIA